MNELPAPKAWLLLWTWTENLKPKTRVQLLFFIMMRNLPRQIMMKLSSNYELSLIFAILVLLYKIISDNFPNIGLSKIWTEIFGFLQVVRTTVTSCHLKCRTLEDCVAYGTLTNVMMGNNILYFIGQNLRGKNFRRTKFLCGQNFRYKLKISAVLSANFFFQIRYMSKKNKHIPNATKCAKHT